MVYLTGRSLLSKCYGIARYTRAVKFNVIFARKKSASFPAPIFTRLTSARKNYVQVCCTESHRNQTVHVESTDRNLFAPVSNVRHSIADFHGIRRITHYISCGNLLCLVLSKWDEKCIKCVKITCAHLMTFITE